MLYVSCNYEVPFSFGLRCESVGITDFDLLFMKISISSLPLHQHAMRSETAKVISKLPSVKYKTCENYHVYSTGLSIGD